MKVVAPLVIGAAIVAAVFTLSPAPGAAPTDVILRAASAPVVVGAWSVVADTTAAGGSRLANTDLRVVRPAAALAAPAHYVELTFTADAGTGYRLWLRGKAAGNKYENDSVFVQFSDSVTAAGASTWRIGTTSATSVNLEDCSGCGLAGWGWQDNGYGGLGPLVYFQASGTHRIRMQPREDGLSIDQVVLSPTTYRDRSPGALKNDTTILTGGSTPPGPISLVRWPYLQQVLDRSAVIVWASRSAGPAHARVGGRDFPAVTTPYLRARTGLSYDYYQHEATITGLTPGTTYAYDIFITNVDVNSWADQLTTAPVPGTGTTRFIVFGDSGTGSSAQRTLASLMNNDTFGLALHVGDIAYGNSGGTGDANYATFQSWVFDIYRNWLRRRPFFPSPGNHDTRATTDWGRAYLDLFVLPDEAGAGAYPDHAERYYSFDYGPVHFVALDTERAFQDTARRAEQLRWLDADLAATSQPWKVAYFHRSPFSSGEEHGPDLTVQQAFSPLFEKHGVQLALSGHDHGYERSVPWRTGTDVTRQAVTYVVSGGGGGPLYTMGRSAWTAASATAHNYVRVTIAGCTASLAAIGTNGAAFDSKTIDRCAQASDAGAPAVAFSRPAAGASVTGVVAVQANASDDIAVEKVDLWVDGVLYGIDTASPYAFQWNTAGVAAGTHTLELRAYDADGRRSARTQTVRTTSTAP